MLFGENSSDFSKTAVLTFAYILSSIPKTLPSRLSRKISDRLAEMDYIHSNATRMSSEVRRVLHVPASNLQVGLSRGIEDLARRKDEVNKVKHESDAASKYFANLFRESQECKGTVEQVDLEAPLPDGLGN
jgi:mitofusin 2